MGDTQSRLPELTQQPVFHVDATPDEKYPIRVLQAYLDNCNCEFVADPPDPFIDLMNRHQKQRAEILERAINILSNGV